LDYYLAPRHVYVSARPAVISAVLGSCVSVCIYDKKKCIGGMNNFQLPVAPKAGKATAQYGNAATTALVEVFVRGGSDVTDLEAQIFGGACNSRKSTKDVGKENISVARKVLNKKQIRIVSEDVGGEKGRKVLFNTGSYEIAVLKVEKLRKEDWYPYKLTRV